MDFLFVIIVIVVIVINVVKRIAEFNRGKPGTGDQWRDWQEEEGTTWQQPASPTPSVPRTRPAGEVPPARPQPPEPSESVKRILEQLRRMEAGGRLGSPSSQLPPAAPVVRPAAAPPPLPAPAPAPPRVPASPLTEPATWQSVTAGSDLGSGAGSAAAAIAAGVAESLPRMARMETSAAVAQASLMKAFAAGKLGVETGLSQRRIGVRMHGRGDLRRAILLSEVLGPPRAFDV